MLRGVEYYFMKIPVSIQKKKDFLQWFMQTYNIEAYEMNWFLQELLENERVLFHVHFVQEIQYCPKGIIISTDETNDVNFLFFKENVQTNDVYTAYHELHLYYNEAFYIQMNFPYSKQNNLYQNVLENEISYDYKMKEQTEEILTHLLYEGKVKYVKKEIDNALANGNVEKFLHYSTILKTLDLV